MSHTAGGRGFGRSYCGPDEFGKFGGEFGGIYIGETLVPLVLEIAKQFEECRVDEGFWEELRFYQQHYVGRPSPLYEAIETSKALEAKGRVFFKRDELNHTGSHKINNCLGQVLLAKRMGKKLIIAETGAGQHGVATASVCSLFKMKCVVFMGAKDVERQKVNVFRMKLLGAEVVPVDLGSRSLKDALNEAIRFWASHAEEAYYLIGTVAGPHPYPYMVREFQSIIGQEVRDQLRVYGVKGPTCLMACIGGGSNAMGLFYEFLEDKDVRIVGVESAGMGIETEKHAATMSAGDKGVLHGNLTYVIQDSDGNIGETYSIAAGLDYPGIGPEHAHLKDIGRAEYVSVTDSEAMEAMRSCSRLEGIIPAIEPSHALAYLYKALPDSAEGDVFVVNVCGRGDKDMVTAMDFFADELA